MSNESEKPSKLVFEKYYKEGGVEYSVEYSAEPYLHDKSINGVITLNHVGDIIIPITQLAWVVKCLRRIQRECGVYEEDV